MNDQNSIQIGLSVLKTAAISLIFIVFISVICPQAAKASSQFLWKPRAESRNELVILFPSSFREEKTKSIEVVSASGSDTPYSVSQTGVNGDRIHARFKKPGSNFPPPVTVKMTMTDGTQTYWKIPNPSDRHEDYSNGSTSPGTDQLPTENSALDQIMQGISGRDINDTYVFLEDGTINIKACLLTYGPARLSVTVAGRNGTKRPFMTWSRSHDKDPSKLTVEGKTIDRSNSEVAPGDWTARMVTIPLEGKEGDTVTLSLTGTFLGASPTLEIEENSVVQKK